MTINEKRRPGGNLGGANKSLGGNSSLAPFTPEMAASRAQGVLMLMVFNPENGRVRRRIFLSLHAASKAADRARERGQTAHVVLGRFTVQEVV